MLNAGGVIALGVVTYPVLSHHPVTELQHLVRLPVQVVLDHSAFGGQFRVGTQRGERPGRSPPPWATGATVNAPRS
jgi:hypothetical protein